jgi:hypothetical protein
VTDALGSETMRYTNNSFSYLRANYSRLVGRKNEDLHLAWLTVQRYFATDLDLLVSDEVGKGIKKKNDEYHGLPVKTNNNTNLQPSNLFGKQRTKINKPKVLLVNHAPDYE